MRSNSKTLGEQGMWALHNWLTASFRENKPFDTFVHELITARGATYVDVRLPERPVAGGLGAQTIAPAAPAGTAQAKPNPGAAPPATNTQP